MSAAERFLQYRGSLRSMLARGSTLIFTSVHDEGQPTAVWRVDVEQGTLASDALPCGGLRVIADDRHVLVAGNNNRIYIGPVDGGALSALGGPVPGEPKALAWLSSDRFAVLVGSQIFIRSRDDGRDLQQLTLSEEGTAMVSHDSGTWLVVGTYRGTLVVFDGENKEKFVLSESEKIHEGLITALMFDPDELRVLSTGNDRRLLSTHIRGKLEPEDRGGKGMHDGSVTAMAVGPAEHGDNRRFYTAGEDKVLKSWPCGMGKRRPSTIKDWVTRTVDMATVPFLGKPHVALAFDTGTIRLFPLTDEGKADEHVIALRDANAWAKHELKHGDAERREVALRTLAGYNDARSIEQLAKAVEKDQDHALRALATQLLGGTENRRARPHLERLLSANDEAVRLRAFEGLRKLDGRTSLKPLIAALKVRRADVGVAAVRALEELASRDDSALTRLVAALNDDPAEVRSAALSALERLHPDDVPDGTLTALRSTRSDIRRVALIRLFQRNLLDHAQVQVALRRHGEDADADVRLMAFLVSVKTHPTLADALRHRDLTLHRQLFDLETHGQSEEAKQDLPETSLIPASDLSDDDFRPLLQAMASRALDTCLRGASGLAALQDARAFGTLLQLSRESEASARVTACKALEELGESRAINRLRLMIRDSAPEVRDAAFTALTRLQDDAPLATAEAGLTAEHEDIRRRGLQVLTNWLRSDAPAEPEPEDEEQADLIRRGLRMLGLIRPDSVAAPSELSVAYDLLRRALNDAAESVRSEAFKSCLNLQVAGGGADTLRFVLSSLHADVRLEVLVEVQAQMDENDWAWDLLLELFDDPEQTLRQEAFEFAVKRAKGKLEPLAVALQGRHADLRTAATRALAKKSTDGARALLVKALDDDEKQIRELAIQALMTAEAHESIAQAMASKHPDVRVRAACARAVHGDGRALQPLLALATEEEPEQGDKGAWQKQVVAALRGLTELGSDRAQAAVIPLLSSKDTEIRRAAAYALGWVSRPGKLDALRAALRHSDKEVQKSAALGLAYCGDPAGTSILFARKEAASSSKRRRKSSGSQGVSAEQILLASVGLGAVGQDQLLGLLDTSSSAIQRRALLTVVLLELGEPDGTPDRLLAALSSGSAKVRLISAAALENFAEADAFHQHVVDLVNMREDSSIPWTISDETIRVLSGMLCGDDSQLRVRAVQQLLHLDAKNQDKFDRHWRLFSERFAHEVGAAERQVSANLELGSA